MADGAREVRSFCRTCLASCGLKVTVVGDRVEVIRGDTEHPLSAGYTCAKGRAQGALLRSPQRLLYAAIGKAENRREVGATEIAADIAARLAASSIEAVRTPSRATSAAGSAATRAAGSRCTGCSELSARGADTRR
jgi:predicted molibdopterin-dependent oxidoreductase YjgC